MIGIEKYTAFCAIVIDMNKTIIGIVIVVLLGIGAYMLMKGSGGGATPATNETQTPALSQTAPAPAPSTAAIEIKGFAFNPATVSVKTGTTVTWTNNDTVSHTVTSDSGGLLNSPTLAPGQSFSFTFSAPGTTAYHCAIHPMMKASIVVTN